MFSNGVKFAFLFQMLAAFLWVLTLGSAVVFVIGAFVADWSWSLLFISAGGLALTLIVSGAAMTTFFNSANKEMRRF